MFNVQENKNVIRFYINSEMRHVDRIVRELRDYLEQLQLEINSDFKIVIRELLINAIEHGNQNQVDRSVTCSLKQVKDNLFQVVVEDQGKGFDFNSLEMEIPDDPRQIRNRGYALIKSFSEKIEFNEKGNKVIVYLRLEQETQFIVDEENEIQIIRPSGNLTATVANKFRMLLNDLVDQDCTKYQFDLAEVEDLDSVSLSTLIVFSKMLSRKKEAICLEIINAGEDLVNLFKMMRLDNTYKILV